MKMLNFSFGYSNATIESKNSSRNGVAFGMAIAIATFGKFTWSYQINIFI